MSIVGIARPIAPLPHLLLTGDPLLACLHDAVYARKSLASVQPLSQLTVYRLRGRASPSLLFCNELPHWENPSLIIKPCA